MGSTFEITDERDAFVIRFDKNLIDRQQLSQMLHRLEVEAIRMRSRLSPEKAAELARDVDDAVWERVKNKYRQ